MRQLTIYIMQNFRLSHSKAWNKRHANWVVMSRLTGNGSGVSTDLCIELGVDPDAYEFKKICTTQPKQEAGE